VNDDSVKYLNPDLAIDPEPDQAVAPLEKPEVVVSPSAAKGTQMTNVVELVTSQLANKESEFSISQLIKTFE
jgi:hypothetical protein